MAKNAEYKYRTERNNDMMIYEIWILIYIFGICTYNVLASIIRKVCTYLEIGKVPGE